jgi:hypothetical protein
MRQRLHALEIRFKKAVVTRSGADQLFLRDPGGVEVELSYAASN